jgi:2,4-dienoyl-CoA reductase-like NADH-dependent reductase (Old Yellow Enzyme family)
MSVQPLFTPIRVGDLHPHNRIVMAPLTRMRAEPIDHVPDRCPARRISGPRGYFDYPTLRRVIA